LTTQHALLDLAIKKIGNRYLTTMLIAKRIRQLHHGARPRVEREEGESYFSVAVREVAEGMLRLTPDSASLTLDINGVSALPPASPEEVPQV
jgi:DNA-directed RNA polymerase omega subunit